MATFHFSFRDYSDEIGRLSLLGEEPADLTTVGDWDDQLASLSSALAGVTLGTIAQEYGRLRVTEDGSTPASALAQREFGLRVFYEGDTDGAKGHITVPTVDIASLTVIPNSDLVDLADAGVMAALVTAMENYGRLPYGAGVQNITVTKAMIVGRNS